MQNQNIKAAGATQAGTTIQNYTISLYFYIPLLYIQVALTKQRLEHPF